MGKLSVEAYEAIARSAHVIKNVQETNEGVISVDVSFGEIKVLMMHAAYVETFNDFKITKREGGGEYQYEFYHITDGVKFYTLATSDQAKSSGVMWVES